MFPALVMMFRDFNSIKVRLKRILAGFNTADVRGFQFHKGTIKTFDAKTEYFYFNNDFNSIKVRLKL